MSKSSSIVLVAVASGAIAVSAAVVTAAFVMVDHRVAQLLQSDSRVVPAQKKGEPAARSGRRVGRSGGHQATRTASAPAPRVPAPTLSQTIGSAAGAGSPGSPPAFRQGSVGEPAAAPETMHDNRHKRRLEAHQRHRKHRRHAGRISHGNEASGYAPGGEGGDQSGFFFPFH